MDTVHQTATGTSAWTLGSNHAQRFPQGSSSLPTLNCSPGSCPSILLLAGCSWDPPRRAFCSRGPSGSFPTVPGGWVDGCPPCISVTAEFSSSICEVGVCSSAGLEGPKCAWSLIKGFPPPRPLQAAPGDPEAHGCVEQTFLLSQWVSRVRPGPSLNTRPMVLITGHLRCLHPVGTCQHLPGARQPGSLFL